MSAIVFQALSNVCAHKTIQCYLDSVIMKKLVKDRKIVCRSVLSIWIKVNQLKKWNVRFPSSKQGSYVDTWGEWCFKFILTIMLTYKIVCKNEVPCSFAACIHLAMLKIRSYIFAQLLSFMTKLCPRCLNTHPGYYSYRLCHLKSRNSSLCTTVTWGSLINASPFLCTQSE